MSSTPATLREIVLARWVPVLLAGALLALLPYLYWERQVEAGKRELYLQEKVKAHAAASASLTRLIAYVNDEVYENQKRPSVDRERRLRDLEDKITQTGSDVSSALSAVGIYFGPAARAKADELRKLSYRDGAIEAASPFFITVRELNALLAEELRREFRD